MQELKKHKINIFNLLFTIFTYFSLLIYFKIIFSNNSYNFLLLVLFFLIFAFYNKFGLSYKKSDKKTKAFSSLLALILSFILIIGSLVSSHVTESVGLIFNNHNLIYSVIGIIGFYLFFRVCMCFLLKVNIKINDQKRKINIRLFLIIFGIILILYLPYYFRFFPAVMTNDSYYSIHYVQNLILSDYHSFGHTWFFGIFYYLGMIIFNNQIMAVGFFTFIQMMLCVLIFTYIIKFLYEKGVKKIYLIIVILFFGLSPLFAIYSVTLWRDILFGMSFAILFISLYNFIDNNYQFDKLNLILYILSIITILFFRNNGIYIVLLFVPLFIWFAKTKRKNIAFLNIVIIILYFVIKGPLFSYFDVQKTTSVEAFSMPLQQISRVIANDGNIDKKSYKYLNDILDISNIKENYDPTISDYVKRSADNEKISSSKLKFLTIYMKIGVNNPRIYTESYLCSTLGYWYPDVIYWATAGESSSIFGDVKVHSKTLGPSLLKKIDILTSRKLPLSNLLWSIGTMFIVLIVSTFLLIYKQRTKYLLCYIPLYCLWVSLMLASPVFAELRYIYGLFVCVPLLLVVPFLKNSTK